jgi:hypothetical protein
MANPIALGPVHDGLAFRILEGRTDATLKKRLKNLALRCPCLLRAGSAAARVLHRQMKGSGTGFVSDGRITAGRQKTFNGGGTSRPYGAVQGCRPVLVLCINIGSSFEQKTNHRNLSLSVPKRAFQVTIRGVVQGLTPAAIFGRARIRPGAQKHSGDLYPITGCGDM